MHRSSDDFAMLTIFDEEASARTVPANYDSGADPTFTIYDGVARGVAVLARFTWWKALLGFKVEPYDGPLTVTVDIKLDDVTHAWWMRKHKDEERGSSQTVRHVLVRCQGQVVGGFSATGELQHISHTFVVDGRSIPEGGLLMLDFGGFNTDGFSRIPNADPLRGLEITRINIQTGTWQSSPQTYIDVEGRDAKWAPQGVAVTDDEPAVVRLRVVEQPRLATSPDAGLVAKTLARGRRKVGTIQRQRWRDSQQEPAAADAVQCAFPIVAKRPDGSEAAVHTRIDRDVLEIEFLPSPDGSRKVSVFEVQTNAEGLREIGFHERVAFKPIA